jgi:hypothetical protein
MPHFQCLRPPYWEISPHHYLNPKQSLIESVNLVLLVIKTKKESFYKTDSNISNLDFS